MHPHHVRRFFYMGCVLLGLLLAYPAWAQEPVFLSLNSPETTLQTGQIYEVQIVVENAADLWVTSVNIQYDSNLLYILGTDSGSPVQPGPLLEGKATLVPRNDTGGDVIHYTVSLLAPAEPIQGSGVLATFRVAPLDAGSSQLTFQQASLTAIRFEETNGTRVASEPQPLAFTPVLLELTAQGDRVDPPSELTATPPPSSTPLTDLTEEANVPTLEAAATLVNVTRAPTLVPTVEPPVTAENSPSPVLLGAVAVLVITGIGLLALLILYLRRYRR
ncbi:MAG: cohesin domain-containing protein [Anaerolineae bacterium]|nr:cohesin domain-containing protein [Anaerolineae bacterium]